MSFGAFLGGALQGVGAGIVRQAEINERKAESEASRRHDEAMNNLRHTQSLAMVDKQGDMSDRNAARSDERGDFYDSRRNERALSSDIVRYGAQAGHQANADNRRFAQNVQMQSIQFANERDMTAFKANLARQDAAYRHSLEAGDVVDTMIGADGYYYGRRRNGEMFRTEVQAPPPQSSSGGSSLLLNTPPPSAGAAPRPAPAAAPRSAAGGAPASQAAQVPRMTSAAQAQAFVSNPANRGKEFIGPDGLTYRANQQ